jgi:hypothetical protein
LSTLIGVSLAGIAEIGFRRFGHCASRSCVAHCSSRVEDQDRAGPQPRQATAPSLERVHQGMTTCAGSVIGASQVMLRQT